MLLSFWRWLCVSFQVIRWKKLVHINVWMTWGNLSIHESTLFDSSSAVFVESKQNSVYSATKNRNSRKSVTIIRSYLITKLPKNCICMCKKRQQGLHCPKKSINDLKLSKNFSIHSPFASQQECWINVWLDLLEKVQFHGKCLTTQAIAAVNVVSINSFFFGEEGGAKSECGNLLTNHINIGTTDRNFNTHR